MTTSTASSPSFLAGLIGPSSRSRRVWETSGRACRRDLMMAASRERTSLLMTWLIHRRRDHENRELRRYSPKGGMTGAGRRCRSRIEPQRQARFGHMALGLADRVFAVVEDRGREHGRGMALADALDQVIERAHAAARDHRHGHGVGDGAGEFEIETFSRAVAIHGGEQDLARAERRHLARIAERFDAGRLAPAMAENFEARLPALAGHALRVDGDDYALRAELLGNRAHQASVLHRRRVDGDLVGAGFEQCAHVLDRAYPAADRERHEAALGGAAYDVENGAALLVACRDVEEAKFVRARLVVSRGRLHRVAGVAQIDELDAFDDAPLFHVEARDETDLQHGQNGCCRPMSASASCGSSRPS